MPILDYIDNFIKFIIKFKIGKFKKKTQRNEISKFSDTHCTFQQYESSNGARAKIFLIKILIFLSVLSVRTFKNLL